MTTETAYIKRLLKMQAEAEAAMKRVYHQYIDSVTKYARNPKLKFSKSFQIRNNEFLGAILTGEHSGMDCLRLTKTLLLGRGKWQGKRIQRYFLLTFPF